MEEREENPHERLKQKLSELEKVWTALKTGKSSSAVSCITVEKALELVENSPRKLMISLQHDQACQEAELKSPYRRKLFQDSDVDDDDDDETRMTTFSHSTCWSSNAMRAGDNNNKINKKHEKKNRGSIVCGSVIALSLWVLVVLINGFDDQLSENRHINTLVPT